MRRPLILLSIVLLFTLSNASSFWDRFDELYQGKIRESMDDYIEEYKEKELTGIIDDEVVINTEDKLSGLNIVGSGVHWWTGKFYPSIIENTYDMRNTYTFDNLNKTYRVPDEVFVVNTPLVEDTAEVEVQSNLNEYATNKRRKYGFGVGFGGVISIGGSKEIGKGKTIFRSETVRTTSVEQKATYYTMNLIPPQYLKLKSEFSEIFTSLPPYDESTKKIWFDQLDRYGTHIVISAIEGGKLNMEEEIDLVTVGEKDSKWVSKNANLMFLFMTAETPALKKKYEEQIDADYKKFEKREIKYEGGNTTLPFDKHREWIQTLPRNMTYLRLRTIPIAELFPESQLRTDLGDAINEYLVQFAPTDIQPFLGPEIPVGTSSSGASIQVSSIKEECYKKCKSGMKLCCKVKIKKCFKTKCDKFPTQNELISGGGTFGFHKDDKAQTATVTLKKEYYVSRMVATVAGPGKAGPVSLVQAHTGNTLWSPTYQSGKTTIPANGVCPFKIHEKYPTKANSVKFSFGQAPPGVGSNIFNLEVFAIEDSTPAGHVDVFSLTEISGWAFDPINPWLPLEIEIRDGDNVIARGKTGVDRPDVVKNFDLPQDAKPGFSIKLDVPNSPAKRYEVVALWKGVTKTGRSQTAKLWNIMPSGKMTNATNSFVEGWAYHPHHKADNYKVEVYVNGKLEGTTVTNLESKVVNQIYGVSGKYGWRVPVNIKAAGQHIVTAKVILPDGTKVDLPEEKIIDLRYPKGMIFQVTPSYVSGFAYDPSRPNSAAEVQIYVDDQPVASGRTNIVIPELNDLYLIQGPHGFNISLRMQGGKTHLVSVYVFVNDTVRSLIETRPISIGLDDGGDNKLTTSIINYAGVGYDPCSGEWRLRVVDFNYKKNKKLNDSYWEPSKLRGLPVPDEMDFTRNSKVSYVNETQIFNSTKDWARYVSRKTSFGINLGLIGFGGSYRKDIYENILKNRKGRLSSSERNIEFFKATLDPPELLNFASYAGDTFKNLPPYNPATRPQYFRAFDLFGVAYAKELRLGGKMELEMTYETIEETSQRLEFESKQSGFIFTYLVSLSFSHEKGKAEANIDKAFMESTKRSVRLVGGTPESFSPEDSVEWTKSIIKNPGITDMHLELITELFDPIEDADRRGWVLDAIKDYMSICTPERWVCDTINAATKKDSARVILPSSSHSKGKEIALSNLLLEESKQIPWGPNGEKSFIFADNDQDQSFVLELHNVMKIKRIGVDVDVYPSQRAVWDFIKVDVSKDLKKWEFWGMVGQRDGTIDVKEEHYDFNVLTPQDVKYIRFSFGAVRSDTKKGSSVRRVYAYTCA